MLAGYKDLKVYQKAFSLAMEIFQLSKAFSPEERYSLTSQIRRSSRSVAANLAEGYRKRQYPSMFVSKLADCDAEATETQVWLDFACDQRMADRHDSAFGDAHQDARTDEHREGAGQTGQE